MASFLTRLQDHRRRTQGGTTMGEDIVALDRKATGFLRAQGKKLASPAPSMASPQNRGATGTWDSGVAPQAPTVATQGAAASTAQSGGGVMPPFMAPKPASPFPATPAAPVAGPTIASATTAASFLRPSPAASAPLAPVAPPAMAPIAGVAAGVPTPPSVAQKIATPTPATPEQPFMVAPEGSAATFLRSANRNTPVEAMPGGMAVPAANLNVGEASVVAGPKFFQAQREKPTDMGSQQGLDNLATATNAMAGLDRTPNFTNEQVQAQSAGVNRLKRGFMSPRERADTLTGERRAADRAFMGDKLTAAKDIETTKAGAATDEAKTQADAEKYKVDKMAEMGAFNETAKPGRFKEMYTGGVLDTATGALNKPAVNLDAYNSAYDSKKGVGMLTRFPNVSNGNQAVLDQEWSKTGLPSERAPHRGGRGLDFDTPEEVDSLLLPRGTRITIRGRPAIVE